MTKSKFSSRHDRLGLLRLALLFVAGMVSLVTWAQLSTEKTYLIKSVATEQYVSSQNKGVNNTPVVVENRDESATGQKWQLVKAGTDDNTYLIVSAAWSSVAIDVAADAAANVKYNLLLWDADKTSKNQQINLVPVAGKAGTYRMVWTYDTELAVNTSGQNGRLKLTEATETSTEEFVFVETEAQPAQPLQQLSTSATYMIKNPATGKAWTNKGNYDNNAPITTADADENDNGQKWKLQSIGTDTYLIVSAVRPTAAIDVAPNKQYYLLHWTADTKSKNQILTIKKSSDDADTWRITWGDGTKAVNVQSDGRLRLTDDLTSESSLFSFVTTTEPTKDSWSYWQDETIFEENELKPHATFMPYASTEKLHADKERYNHPWVDPTGAEWMSLNGVWKLKWTSDMSDRPAAADFSDDNADVSAWDTISVPSCFEMKGYGQPYYLNDQYAFDDNYPYITVTGGYLNGLGSLRRTFTLPEGWKDKKRVVLRFEGIYSAAYVWVNGQYVGYTEGANNESEFDVSKVVREGENNIAVQVIRFSDGSYLEGQDMWRMSGIHRDVSLYTTPTTYVSDHVITAALDNTYKAGTMNVNLSMDNPAKTAVTKQVCIKLIAPDGSEVATKTADFAFAEGEETATQDVAFSGLSGLLGWTAETPNLYTVEVAQLNADGKEEMAFATKYGFRKVELKGGKLYVNGKITYLRGVNAQDTHPVHGRAMDVATMLRDITMMKQANINTFRTSHYPRQAKMYAISDYYGLYVMDEADIECHYDWTYNNNVISGASSWKAAFVDRMDHMVRRDRNHPSVIFWSLGNESGTGANLQACYDHAKELDPDRAIHYEGATRGWANYTDMYSVMYPTIAAVKNDANNNRMGQPYFACEYAHSMGNSTGNLREYVEAIEDSKYGIGGCIWDWVDQSIYSADDIKKGKLVSNGYDRYMSGYDYTSTRGQGNFVNNGLIPANRAWSSKLAQVKQVFQYAKFGNWNKSQKKLYISNAYSFTNLNTYELAYTILRNGTAVETGTTDMPSIPAGMTNIAVAIPYTTTLDKGVEYCLNVELRLKEATPWAEAGYPVAAHQVVLQERSALAAADPGNSMLDVEQNQYSNYVISNDNIRLLLDTNSGRLRSWAYGDYTLMDDEQDKSFDLDIYRWVENDNTAAWSNDSYQTNGITKRSLKESPVTHTDGTVTFTVSNTGSNADVTYAYTVYPSGIIDLTTTYEPHVSDLRRLGTQLILPVGLENVEYYARGPWDNFWDRNDASFLGRYTTKVSEMLETMPRPQTSGVRTDLRDLTLTDSAANFSLKIETEGKVDLQLLHYTDQQMAAVKHRWNLANKLDKTVLHLDYMQRGLGNGSCGRGTGTLSEYSIPSEGTFTNKVRFTPIHGTPSGIDETADATSLSVKSHKGTVTATGNIPAGTHLTVYDLGGSLVGKAYTAAPAQSLSVSIIGQPAGTYIARVAGKSYKVIK